MSKKLVTVAAIGALAWWWFRQKDGGQESYLLPAEGFTGLSGLMASVSYVVSDVLGGNFGMNISTMYLGLVKSAERFEPRAYYASKAEKAKGSLTIGYGHVLINGDGLSGDSVLSESDALGLLVSDIEKKAKYARRVKPKLTQGQFDAVVDFIFQAGQGNFMASSGSRAKAWGLNPLKVFNDVGLDAGFAEIERYMLKVGAANPSEAKGHARRQEARRRMAVEGVYRF